MKNALLIIFATFFLVITFGLLLRPGTGPKQTQSVALCASDWTKCVDNHDFANHSGLIAKIAEACEQDVRDGLSFEGRKVWNDVRFPAKSFRTYYADFAYVAKEGRWLAMEDNAQFLRGTWEDRVVFCNYALRPAPPSVLFSSGLRANEAKAINFPAHGPTDPKKYPKQYEAND